MNSDSAFQSPADQPDFFVSYAKPDQHWAEWIAWVLEESRYTTILQAWDFKPGGNFVHLMQKGTAASTTIAVLSKNYTDSAFCSAEWYAGFAKDSTGEQMRLLPIRVEDFEPEGLLGQVIYLDFVGLSEDQARRALLDAVTKRRLKPSVQPSYPSKTRGDKKNPKPRFPTGVAIGSAFAAGTAIGVAAGVSVERVRQNTDDHKQHLDNLRRKDSLGGAETASVSVRLGTIYAGSAHSKLHDHKNASSELVITKITPLVQSVYHQRAWNEISWTSWLGLKCSRSFSSWIDHNELSTFGITLRNNSFSDLVIRRCMFCIEGLCTERQYDWRTLEYPIDHAGHIEVWLNDLRVCAWTKIPLSLTLASGTEQTIWLWFKSTAISSGEFWDVQGPLIILCKKKTKASTRLELVLHRESREMHSRRDFLSGLFRR